MRGQDRQQSAMFSYVSPEERVPAEHPLRPIREMADVALKSLSAVFDRMYATFGRPSIAPEKLLRALLVQVLYTVRSERMLMEQLQYNLLFRWFVGMNMDESVWVPTVFSKNRDRLMEGDVAEKFFALILDQAAAAGLLSDEHFSVDGTLIEAWASQKSFQRKDKPEAPPPDDPGNPTVNFHGEIRRNDTHESKTDPDARLARKSGGHESKLAYCGNAMIENRNGLVVDTELVPCSGNAERDAALLMVECIPGAGRATVAGDKGYDTGIDFSGEHFINDWQQIGERSNCRQRCGAVRPHKPADSGQSQCVLDGDEWQPSLVKLCGPQTIGPASDAAGARRRTISFQQSADILALIHQS